MSRLPIPGSDQGSWGQILNDYLSQSHNADGTLKTGAVSAGNIADGTITEAKLDSSVATKLNSSGGAVTSVAGKTGAVTLVKADVGLSNVDNTSDTNKPVSTAVQTALNGKANSVHTHTISDVTGLQTALDNKMDAGALTLDSLTDVSASGATDGQSLVFTSGTWGPATVASGSPAVVDATSSAKGVLQLAGDLGGTASAPTVPGLAGKASTGTTITGATSLTGGGSLAANRTLSLVNDSATPGNSKYYGTDGSGTKGYFTLPAGSSDPTLGGDLSGTASTAQIVAGAVGATELATNAVTTAKITDANVTLAKIATTGATSGQVLGYNGTALAWTTPSGGGGGVSYTFRNITATTTAVAGNFIFADSTSGAITVTLPAPAASALVRVKRLNAAGNGIQVVAPNGSYIDGSTVGSHTINNQYDSQDFLSDGTNWYRV